MTAFLLSCILVAFPRGDELKESTRDQMGYHRASNQYEKVIRQGARVIDLPEEESFAVLWTPADWTSGRIMVALHGTGGTGYEEAGDELPLAKKHGYMVVAVQWFNREKRKFYSAEQVYRIIDRALRHVAARHKVDLTRVGLIGFSRGAAVSYEVAYLDLQSKKYFSLVIAHSGGIARDLVVAPLENHEPDPFLRKLTSGELGKKALEGSRFFLYSGDRDVTREMNMSENVAYAREVITRLGGKVVEYVRDPEGEHMGYRRNPSVSDKAMKHFLSLTK